MKRIIEAIIDFALDTDYEIDLEEQDVNFINNVNEDELKFNNYVLTFLSRLYDNEEFH